MVTKRTKNWLIMLHGGFTAAMSVFVVPIIIVMYSGDLFLTIMGTLMSFALNLWFFQSVLINIPVKENRR